MEIYVKMSVLFPYFVCFFLAFKHDIHYTSIAATNTESDDVTNYVTKRIFNVTYHISCSFSSRNL